MPKIKPLLMIAFDLGRSCAGEPEQDTLIAKLRKRFRDFEVLERDRLKYNISSLHMLGQEFFLDRQDVEIDGAAWSRSVYLHETGVIHLVFEARDVEHASAGVARGMARDLIDHFLSSDFDYDTFFNGGAVLKSNRYCPVWEVRELAEEAGLPERWLYRFQNMRAVFVEDPGGSSSEVALEPGSFHSTVPAAIWTETQFSLLRLIHAQWFSHQTSIHELWELHETASCFFSQKSTIEISEYFQFQRYLHDRRSRIFRRTFLASNPNLFLKHAEEQAFADRFYEAYEFAPQFKALDHISERLDYFMSAVSEFSTNFYEMRSTDFERNLQLLFFLNTTIGLASLIFMAFDNSIQSDLIVHPAHVLVGVTIVGFVILYYGLKIRFFAKYRKVYSEYTQFWKRLKQDGKRE
ncbi:hypothetical protein FDP25_00765 [Roseovarius sp. A21]|uniref:Uncharacterized protein n=1 Tax=Roseovarius bejariae TaxID=2576383 RepID=A0A844CRS2_9RHOB|nr:hypothetical protein [Roseovarius bejariae]MRU13956.1 hypothetical protein [Roseovarius bejariae]